MAIIITSTKDYKWKKKEVAESSFSVIDFKVDISNKDQSIFGFGGAFTDAASISFHSLSNKKQDEYLKAYFSNDGLQYNLGRYPLQSTDFSEHSYAYINEKGEFDMSMDEQRINFVKRAKYLSPSLWMIAAPWSPPSFMKDNHDMYHGGKLLKEYYPLWAETLIKAAKYLNENDIPINCLTVQNEPEATQVWESCRYGAYEEAVFLKDYLIPAANNMGMGYLKFMVWDHNRDLMLSRTNDLIGFGLDPQSIFGVAYHWYDRDSFIEVKKTHDKYPDFHILLTECCVELLCADNKGVGSWENGMRYAINIIKDLNNGSEGYIDWNLSLFKNGGPNHVGNYCEAPLMIDEEKDEIIYMPSYYVIGHFSKYLNKACVHLINPTMIKGVDITTFIDTKSDSIIIIFVNDKDNSEDISIEVKGKHYSLLIPQKSVNTFIY